MRFTDRWRSLAALARPDEGAPRSLPADLARRARRRPTEPIPFVPAPWGRTLAVAAAVLTAALLPLALAPARPLPLSTVTRLPPPPALPAPPALESPGHYLALVHRAWKDLAP